MEISPEAKSVMKDLNAPHLKAFEELKNQLVLGWNSGSAKKDTEFDTIWAMAEREGKLKGVLEFLNLLYKM